MRRHSGLIALIVTMALIVACDAGRTQATVVTDHRIRPASQYTYTMYCDMVDGVIYRPDGQVFKINAHVSGRYPVTFQTQGTPRVEDDVPVFTYWYIVSAHNPTWADR